MAREAKFRTEATWFVPDIEDNRSDPDPFRVLIQPMSGAEAAEIEHALERSVSVRQLSLNRGGFLEHVHMAQEEALRKHVLEVHGYVTVNENTGERLTPKTGAELVDAIRRGQASERPLIQHIVRAIEEHSRLSEGVEKNSDSPSASGPVVTPPGSGSAPSARATAGTAVTSEQRAVASSQTKASGSHGRPSCDGAHGP